jgi:hypothetical protein
MKPGYDLSEATVARYMIKRRGRPTQNWKTFLDNHLGETCAIDFLTVPTHPTAAWTASQLHQAFPFDTAPRFLVRDRDGIYGAEVQQALRRMNIEEKVISARSPWQNGYANVSSGRSNASA